MKEIKLSKGYIALIDDEDFERSSKYKWHVSINKNRFSSIAYAKGRVGNKRIYLHHFILGVDGSGNLIDHKDRNGLNCQKHNLRFADKSKNGANQQKRRTDTKSKFKGVYQDKKTKHWVSEITVSGMKHRLGRFDTEVSAANAYNGAALKYFGEFSVLNRIDKDAKILPVRKLSKTSKYLGVCWLDKKKRWRMAVQKGNRTLVARIFKTEIEAAKAYNYFALQLLHDPLKLNEV